MGLKKGIFNQSVSPVEEKIVEAATGKKRAANASTRRIQVTLSEENFDLLEAKADRAGTTMSAMASIFIDEMLHPGQTPMPRVQSREELEARLLKPDAAKARAADRLKSLNEQLANR